MTTTYPAHGATQAWNWQTGAHPIDQSVHEAMHGAPVHQAQPPGPQGPQGPQGPSPSHRGQHVDTTA